MSTIEQAWLQCGVGALERDVPAAYLAECRYAFYMGVKTVLDKLNGGHSDSMSGVRDEIEAYFAAVHRK